MGYGEKPRRLLCIYILYVLGSAALLVCELFSPILGNYVEMGGGGEGGKPKKTGARSARERGAAKTC